MLNVILLLLGVFSCGMYSLTMKSVNLRCTSKAETLLCNAAVTLVAFICSGVSFFLQQGMPLPASGIMWAGAFGVIFSLTVFTNLLALDHGPLSLTTLIVNFSLILTLLYSFLFLEERITLVRIIGIVILVSCMFLYANPKVREGEKGGKHSVFKWLTCALFAFLGNGLLCIVQKQYAVNTDNAYAEAFLCWGYFFATFTSAVLFAFTSLRQRKESRVRPEKLLTPALMWNLLLLGGFNFLMNLMVVILATRMESVIVYPVIQVGGPILVTLGSRIIFKERITAIKALAILLGCTAILLLNF